MDMKRELVRICQRCAKPARGVVVAEPYIPYLPEKWDGTLVLAEAQNLSERNDEYVAKLKKLSPRGRILRLGAPRLRKVPGSIAIGVRPWDDGSVKLALEVLGLDHRRVAVSNAVLWSQKSGAANITPEERLRELSVPIWVEMLDVLQPKRIVAVGVIAGRIVDQALAANSTTPVVLRLRHPSPRQMNAVAAMFSEKDLLRRYREVRLVVGRDPPWLEPQLDKELPRKAKIVYACHAVSMAKETGLASRNKRAAKTKKTTKKGKR